MNRLLTIKKSINFLTANEKYDTQKREGKKRQRGRARPREKMTHIKQAKKEGGKQRREKWKEGEGGGVREKEKKERKSENLGKKRRKEKKVKWNQVDTFTFPSALVCVTKRRGKKEKKNTAPKSTILTYAYTEFIPLPSIPSSLSSLTLPSLPVPHLSSLEYSSTALLFLPFLSLISSPLLLFFRLTP